MASKGPYTTIQFKIDRFEDDYCYFAFPDRVRVNTKTAQLEVLGKNNPHKGEWIPARLNRSGKGMPLRVSFGKHSYSAARLVYMAFNPKDLSSSLPVQYKDLNSSNLSPDNLYLGPMGVTRSKRAGTYDPEWNKKVEEAIPNPAERNVRNPIYMKLLNSKKGADGLNHCERYRLNKIKRRKALKGGLNSELNLQNPTSEVNNG